MKKIIISLGFIALALGATAQVKIKDGSVTGSSTTPNSNAILELESNNKGLLYPRVSLTATNAALPGTTMVAGMVVYNTNTVTGTNGVTPGFYYSDGAVWVRIAQGSPDWRVFGSSTGSNGLPAANTDSQYVMGRVAIGTNTAARVAADTSGSNAAQRFATLTVVGGDAYINGLIVGHGGGQVASNTVLGINALQANTTTGVNSVAIGTAALQANTTGLDAVAAGYNALLSNTTGNYNVAVGHIALRANTTGNNNTAVGMHAIFQNALGSNNTAIGSFVLDNDTAGSNITVLGYRAGATQISGNNNIALGAQTYFPNTTGNYQLNIGNTIWGTGVDSTVGNAANIGINTSAPNSSFQVNGSQSGTVNVQNGSTNPYPLNATDYTVLFTGSGTGLAATLPPSPGITGRIYRIVNQSGGTLAVSSTSGITFLNGTTANLAIGTAVTFQAANSRWYQIQ